MTGTVRQVGPWVLGAGVGLGVVLAYHLGRQAGALGPRTRAAAVPPAGFVGLSPPWLNLGEQMWNTLVPFELEFINEGATAVQVKDIRSSCGCTVVDLPTDGERNVQTGERVTLLGTLETRTRVGDQEHTVRVVLDDGRTYSGTIAAVVQGTYSITPQVLDFGKVQLGEPGELLATDEIVFQSDTDEVVGEPIVDVPWLECERHQTNGTRTRFLVRIRQGECGPGLHTATICLPTSSTCKPHACLTVRVVVLPELSSARSKRADMDRPERSDHENLAVVLRL